MVIIANAEVEWPEGKLLKPILLLDNVSKWYLKCVNWKYTIGLGAWISTLIIWANSPENK